MKIVTPIVSSTEPHDHKEYTNGPASVHPSVPPFIIQNA